MKSAGRLLAALSAIAFVGGCTVGTASAPPPSRAPQETRAPAGRTGKPVDARQAERLQRVMIPLIRAMNNPRDLDKVRVGIIDDPRINAANAGGHVPRRPVDGAHEAARVECDRAGVPSNGVANSIAGVKPNST